MGDLGLIPGLGRYPGEGKGYPLQYSGLENAMNCGPLVRDPRFQCRGPGFDPWVGKIPWRREWLPTPVFLPGEFQEGQKELDMVE